MRERLITLICALGALLLFLTLFVRGESAGAPAGSAPTTAERGANGLLGAFTWLSGENIRTRAVRERFDRALQRRELAPTGNLLLVTLPVETPFTARERRALDQWLRAGNTLLVLAAIADKPDWAAGRPFHSELVDLTGMSYQGVRAPALAAASPQRSAASSPEPSAAMAAVFERLVQPERTTLVPNRDHAFLAGVRQAAAWSDYPWRARPWQAWTVTVPRFGFALCLAHQRETGEGVLWIRPRGSGTIVVSAFGSLFSNRALGLADNARLLANIVGATLGAGGTVLFDDEHQGRSDAYDPAKFYRDPRLYATIGVLVALWLVWVLGGTRLRVPVARTAAPREAQLVRATGAFLARVLSTPAAARRMFEHFFGRLRGRAPDGADPPWELLERHPHIARADLQRLRDWYAAAYSSERVPLGRLHNLMVRIERQLAA